ncbi:hypothetical protein ECAE60S_04172 [Eoetvoesiella caeni]
MFTCLILCISYFNERLVIREHCEIRCDRYWPIEANEYLLVKSDLEIED